MGSDQLTDVGTIHDSYHVSPPPPDGRPRAAASQRRKALRAGEAAAWLEERGYRVDAPHLDTLQVFADELSGPGFLVQRIWHTPLRLSHSGTEEDPRGVRVILQIQGDLAVGIDLSDAVDVGPESMVALGANNPFSLSAADATARIMIVARPASAEWRRMEYGELRVRADATSSWSVLAAHVTALLNSPVTSGDTVFPMLRMSTEALTTALLLDSLDREGEAIRDRRSGDLFSAGMALIRAEARDVRLTVDGLARELHVSRRYLAMAFARHGTSVSIQLRAERLRIARRYLSTVAERPGWEEVASLSGFVSARALQEALRRESDSPLTGSRDLAITRTAPLTARVPGTDM